MEQTIIYCILAIPVIMALWIEHRRLAHKRRKEREYRNYKQTHK